MPQTVQLLRTLTNNAPTSLLPGELSVELGGETKLWVGASAGNRLLISTDPADLPAAGNNFLPLSGGVLTGNLSLAHLSPTLTVGNSTTSGNPAITLAKAAANNQCTIQSTRGGLTRWQILLGDTVAETGGDAGTRLRIVPFSDGGSQKGDLVRIDRDTMQIRLGQATSDVLILGTATLSLTPTAPTHAANMGYVDAGDNSIRAAYLALAGGVMVGAIHLPASPPTEDLEATNKAYVDLQIQVLQEQIDVLTDNLSFSGQIDVPGDNGTYTPASGIPAGPLPPPSAALRGYYIIVNTGGQPPGVSNIPQGSYARGDWLICDGVEWIDLHLGLTSVIAPEVATSPFIPNLGTNVQTGLQWLYDWKVNKAGDTMSGGLSFGSAGAASADDLSRHIALWGTQYGINNTANRQNYVCTAPVSSHVFRVGGSDIFAVGNNLITANQPIMLPGAPTADLHAASKAYVDSLTGIQAVTVDGVSIVGDGTPTGPLECFRLDAGTY